MPKKGWELDYVAKPLGACPECESENIEEDHTGYSTSQDEIYVHLECNDCDFAWVETYKLIRVKEDKE